MSEIAVLITELFPTARPQVYKRRQVIYNEGDAPQGIYLIQQGLVGLFNVTEKGHETLLRIFTHGQIFGHRALLAGGAYHASSMCLIESQIIRIAKNDFEQALETNPKLLKQLAILLAKELKMAELRLAAFVDKSAFLRTAEALVFLKLRHPNYKWTRKEIAEFAGVTMETAARALSKFEEQELIHKSGREIEINDPEKLIHYASDAF